MNERLWGILRDAFPELRIRVINVVDLMRLQADTQHPHGMSQQEYDLLFTKDKPILFAYHGYPSLIHELTYKRTNKNLHVRGYIEEARVAAGGRAVTLTEVLARHPLIPTELDVNAVSVFLSLQYIPDPDTIYRNVRKLPLCGHPQRVAPLLRDAVPPRGRPHPAWNTDTRQLPLQGLRMQGRLEA